VIESREVSTGESVRRRRQCLACQHRFTTYERIERPQLVVIKRDGTRQLFNRQKLMIGIQRACEKTTVTQLQIEELVAEVEGKLYALAESEVASSIIGQYVIDGLIELSDVAYVRFASVYRKFTDLESFERELEKLRRRFSKEAGIKEDKQRES